MLVIGNQPVTAPYAVLLLQYLVLSTIESTDYMACTGRRCRIF